MRFPALALCCLLFTLPFAACKRGADPKAGSATRSNVASSAAPAIAEETPMPPVEHQWNLADLYADDGAWSTAYAAQEARLPELLAFRGTLGKSGARLADALDLYYALEKEISRVYSYASKRSDVDTRNAAALEMNQTP